MTNFSGRKPSDHVRNTEDTTGLRYGPSYAAAMQAERNTRSEPFRLRNGTIVHTFHGDNPWGEVIDQGGSVVTIAAYNVTNTGLAGTYKVARDGIHKVGRQYRFKGTVESAAQMARRAVTS